MRCKVTVLLTPLFSEQIVRNFLKYQHKYELVPWALWGQVESFLTLALDGSNGAASRSDRPTPIIKLRFLFRPKLSIALIHVALILPFTCSNLLVLTPLNDIQSFLICTLIILSLTLFGCVHSIRLTAAYCIISNGNSTFHLGLSDIHPLYHDYHWSVI